MIPQPADKFTALKDKRPWNDIRKDEGYWENFWLCVTRYKISDFSNQIEDKAA